MAKTLRPRDLLSALAALPPQRRRSLRVDKGIAEGFLSALRRPVSSEVSRLAAAAPPTAVEEAATPRTVQETPPLPAPAPDEGSRASKIAALREQVLPCAKCIHLAAFRTQVVFGVGNPDAELMFVGEAPGADEDAQGEPFVGRAGQLLTKIIETMGFARCDVYIANVLKCRPDMPPGSTGNRRPTSQEMAACLPYLREQIRIIRPRVIVALGAVALEGLLGLTEVLSRFRGKWQEFEVPGEREGEGMVVPLMPTYHPSYLLRNQSLSEKRKVWEDMLLVLERLGRCVTEKQQGFFLKK